MKEHHDHSSDEKISSSHKDEIDKKQKTSLKKPSKEKKVSKK